MDDEHRKNRHLRKTTPQKEQSPWSEVLARYGTVQFGWPCWWRPYPGLVPPVPLRGPSWEGSLFRAARRTNEWMSRSGGGPLQWRLFVYTSRSRHTSLAAQPSDNLWCSNRPWVCGCPSARASAAQDKGVSGTPDTYSHIFCPVCLRSNWWSIHTCVRTQAHTHHLWVKVDRWTGSFIMRQEEKGGWATSMEQLALHQRDVRDLLPRGWDTNTVFSQCCHLLTTELINMWAVFAVLLMHWPLEWLDPVFPDFSRLSCKRPIDHKH